MRIRMVELFAGIGSQASAMERLGIEHERTAVCEIDEKAYRSYCAIHGDTPNLGDITKVDHLPECDLLTYSFPCQDLSNAGKGRGMAEGSGTRSSLLWEVGRLLEDMRERETLPSVLLMENVDAILNERFRPFFLKWVSKLADLGYHTEYKILNASDFDIPQNRKRCFAVSFLDGRAFVFPRPIPSVRRLSDILEDDVDESYFISADRLRSLILHKKRHEERGNGFGFEVLEPTISIAKTIACKTIRATETLVASPPPRNPGLRVLATWEEYDCQGGDHAPRIMQGTSIRRLTPRECWRAMDFTDGDYDRAKALGTSETQLYRQAGNSICVGVLVAIFREIYHPSEKTVRTISLENWS